MENGSARKAAPIHPFEFSLNAIAQIAGKRLIGFSNRFAQSSRFVRNKRIAEPISVLVPRENFSLTRKTWGARNRALQIYADTAICRPPHLLRANHFVIAGSRFFASSTCGRICDVVALSWIGARGSFATPGSMMNV